MPRVKHGHCANGTTTREYAAYISMLARCYRKTYADYQAIGGVGIRVVRRWRGKNGFINFLKDLGPKPDRTYALVRKDKTKDYSPENCRWEPKYPNRKISYQGQEWSVAELAKEYGIKASTLQMRLASDMPIDYALRAERLSNKRKPRLHFEESIKQKALELYPESFPLKVDCTDLVLIDLVERAANKRDELHHQVIKTTDVGSVIFNIHPQDLGVVVRNLVLSDPDRGAAIAEDVCQRLSIKIVL